jgi:hypothetical protein
MAKKKNVTAARRVFVQSRATATGKTSAEDRAKFRERFEKLASTKEGRAKIQEVTQIQGVRKALASEYGKKSTKTKTTTATTPTTVTAPTTVTPVIPRPVTAMFDLRSTGSAPAKTTTVKIVPPATTKAVGPVVKASSGRSVLGQIYDAQAAVGKQLEKVTKYTRMVTNPFTYNDPPKTGPRIPNLSEYPKMIADAAAVGGFGKALKPTLTFGKTTIRGLMGASPKLKAPTAGPINRIVNQPRPGSLSSTLSRPKTASGVKTGTKVKTSTKKTPKKK